MKYLKSVDKLFKNVKRDRGVTDNKTQVSLMKSMPKENWISKLVSEKYRDGLTWGLKKKILDFLARVLDSPKFGTGPTP